MICEDSFFYLPNLYTFQNDNSFYGSFRGLRFFVEAADSEPEGRRLLARTWLGEYCMEESEILTSEAFPMDEEGYQSLLCWIDQQYQTLLLRQVNNRPPFEKT